MTLERRTPLKRGEPLKRGKPLETRTPLKSSGKPLPRRSKRRKADNADQIPADVREAAFRRAGYTCEARLAGCAETFGLALHHRLRQGQGGPHTVENLVALCLSCHTGSRVAVHQNPAWARLVGLLVRQSDGPPTRAWDREWLTGGMPPHLL